MNKNIINNIGNNENYLPLLLFIFILFFYLVNGFGVTISNDATSNLEQITALDIWSRSSHFTFHLFGIVFYSVFSLFLGFSSITSVEIMLSVFSLLGSISLFYIINEKFNDKLISVLTVLLYAFSTGVFRFSIQLEYLILVPSFALISLGLYVRRYYFFSGIAFAFGLLTSPFIFLFLPVFFLYNEWKSIFSSKNYWFGFGFLLLYLTISYFTFADATTGQWSYKQVLDAYKKYIRELNYLRIAAIWVYGYVRSFFIVVPFIIFGLWKCYNSYRKLFYIILTLLIVHLPAAIPEARYGGYQLTFYPIISLLAALGLAELFKKTKTGFVFIVLIFLFLNSYIVLAERHFNRSLRDTYVMLQNDTSVADSSVLFAYQAGKPIMTVYAPKLQVVNLLSNYQEDMLLLATNFDKNLIKKMVDKYSDLYLLESGVSMPDDNLKLLFSRFVKNQGAKVKGFGKEKLLPYVGSAKFTRLNGYPVDVYRIEKQ